MLPLTIIITVETIAGKSMREVKKLFELWYFTDEVIATIIPHKNAKSVHITYTPTEIPFVIID
jgi:hypothetical protein